MNIKIRLTRKPLSTILWLVLVTAMTVLLCAGAGLWYSSEQTASIIDDLHSTIAYRTDLPYTIISIENGQMWSFEIRNTSVTDQQLLAELDCVEAVYENTLTGGYSPSFRPLVRGVDVNSIDEGYDQVIFIATVTEIEAGWVDGPYDLSAVKLGGIEYTSSQNVKVEIEEYLSVNEELCRIGTEWQNDTGYVNLTYLREQDTQFLEVGGRYLFSGEYYRDNFNPNAVPRYTTYDDGMIDGDQLRAVSETTYQPTVGEEESIPRITTAKVGDPYIARIDGTIEEFLADPAHADWLRILEVQDIAQHSVPILGTDSVESMYLFMDSKARIYEGRAITQEEYDSGARVCVISTTLAQNSGISVGDTIPISQFWCTDEGIAFNSSNVSTDTTPEDGRLNNPTIGNVSTETELMTREEEFTVVGTYLLSSEWSDNSYDFTPNTVFIPKKAQLAGGFGGFSHGGTVTYTTEDGEEMTAMRLSPDASWGVYHAVKLKNGTAEEFQKALVGTGLEGQYIIKDQGYGSILDSIRAVSSSSRQLFALVCLGWLLLLCLYTLLYQGQQRKTLGIMRSLGASSKAAQHYLLGSGMAVAATGVAVGALVSLGLLSKIQELLYDAATVTVTLSSYSPTGPSEQSFRELLTQTQLPASAILALAGAQISLFLLFLYIQSRTLSRRTPRQLLGKT